MENSIRTKRVNLQDSSYWHLFAGRVRNYVDPGQLTSADVNLHCFQKQDDIQVYFYLIHCRYYTY